MRRGREIPIELKEDIAWAIEKLNSSQLELAKRAGLSQGFVSNLVSKNRRVKDPERVEKLIHVVRALSEQRQASAAIDELDAAKIELTLDQLAALFDIAITRLLAPPGGPIPQTARNYVKRPEHAEILGWLKTLPFTRSLIGPPQSGKSTLLYVLAEAAREVGVPATVFECNALDLVDEHDPTVNERLYQHLGEQLITDWEMDASDRPLPSTYTEFSRWLPGVVRRTGEPRPRLLLLDSVDRLPPRVNGDLIQVMRALTNNRSLNRHEITVCCSLSYRSSEVSRVVSRSSLMTLGDGAIHIYWFTRAQVEELAATIGGGAGDCIADVWDYFRGQPFLTHAAFQALKDSEAASIEDLKRMALLGSGDFRSHARLIRELLAAPGDRHDFESTRDAPAGFTFCDSGEEVVEFLERSGLISRHPEIQAPPNKLAYKVECPYYAELSRLHYPPTGNLSEP